MKFLIVNGSPKGKYSTTLHTCLYLRKRHPEHEFSVLEAARTIRSLEEDFSVARAELNAADVIIFSYPVYTFLAPSQLHRFIELMKADLEAGALSIEGKYATQVTTSKHFYDVTAHEFVKRNCEDMGLAFVDGLSADMDDLLSEKGRAEADGFFELLLWKIGMGYSDASVPAHPGSTVPVQHADILSVTPVPRQNDSGLVSEGNGRKSVVVVTDWGEDDRQLRAMVSHFKARLPYECSIVNIRELHLKGGCMGCFNCASTGRCVYPDRFDEVLRERIQSHDAIVYAFKVRDHSMGSNFKMYDDRQFCNGHRTVTMGSPVGYIVDGCLSSENNLRMMLEARAQVGGNFLAGIADNENDPLGSIGRLASTLSYALEHGLQQPSNFFGVGGMKIFRDLIYLMRGIMRADHAFFKAHGQYDFPQNKRMMSLKMYLAGWMMGSRKLRAKLGSKLNEGMIKDYREVVERAEPKILSR